MLRDETLSIDILSELESKFATQGSQLNREIEQLNREIDQVMATLPAPPPSAGWANYNGNRLSADDARDWHNRYTEATGKITAGIDNKKGQSNYQKSLLAGIWDEYQAAVLLLYLDCYGSSKATAQQLLSLQERYQAQRRLILTAGPAFESCKQTNTSISTTFTGCTLLIQATVGAHGMGVALRIVDKFMIALAFQRLHHYGLTAQLSFITSPLLFSTPIVFPSLANNSLSYNVEELFDDRSIVFRMVLAILLDNVNVLKALFGEYNQNHPDQNIIDLIASHALVGLAAANGSTSIMKLFIEMRVNLEQKFILQINATRPGNTLYHAKSVLANYGNCSLEMTPLALALSAAPAMPFDKANELINLMLHAGAKYNGKVDKKWMETHGYHDNLKTTQKSTLTSIFHFDSTGILDSAVKALQESKKAAPQERYLRGPRAAASASADMPDNAHLHTRIRELEQRTAYLEEQVQRLTQIIEQRPVDNAGVSNFQSEESTTQDMRRDPNPRGRRAGQMHRGGRGPGFYDSHRGNPHRGHSSPHASAQPSTASAAAPTTAGAQSTPAPSQPKPFGT